MKFWVGKLMKFPYKVRCFLYFGKFVKQNMKFVKQNMKFVSMFAPKMEVLLEKLVSLAS